MRLWRTLTSRRAGWFGVWLAASLSLASPAYSHEPYDNWKMPDNKQMRCCDGSDCRPTRAQYDSDVGNWRAWTGTFWVWVPNNKVMKPDMLGDGRSHVCEKHGVVYCFSPGEPRI